MYWLSVWNVHAMNSYPQISLCHHQCDDPFSQKPPSHHDSIHMCWLDRSKSTGYITSLDSCGALVLFRFQIEQLGFMMFIHTYTFWPIHRSSDFFAAMDLSASGIFVEIFPVILWLLLYPFSAMSPRMSTCEKWWKMVKTCMAIILILWSL